MRGSPSLSSFSSASRFRQSLRSALVLIAAALIASLAFGSGGIPLMGGVVAAPSVTLEFWTISLQPFFTQYVNAMIADYERAHPGVKIRWVDVQFAAIEQKLLASLAGGVAPDVVNLNTELTIRLAEQGLLVDMDAAVGAADKARYFEGFWAAAKFRGRNYGLPWYVAPNVLVYNAALYRKAGLNPLDPPGTEDEMIAHARVIKDKAKVYGFMPNVDGIRLMHRFQEAGLPMLSSDRKRAVFNSPAHVAYLDRYVRLFKQGYFPEDTMRRGFLGATERYSAGQLGILTTGPQFLLRVKTDNPDVYAQSFVAPYPKGKGNVIHLPTMTVSAPKSTKHAKEAVDFALYVTNDANQLAFSKLVVILPSTRAAAGNPFFKQTGAAPEEKARRIAAAELPLARDLTVVVPHATDLYRIFREAVESAFFGQMTSKEALDWAAKQWTARL